MSDFVMFYLGGGLFNHLVTIGLGVAAAALVFHMRARKQDAEGGASWLVVADRALLACVGLGLLGMMFGTIDAGAALRTVPADQALQPAVLALGLVVIPLAWALMGTIPLWIASTVLRHKQARARAA